MFDLNKLIGVPFKLNKFDFSGCDCRGIVILYYKHVKNIDLPFTDGGRIFFRNKKKDFERIINVLKKITREVIFDELTEGDIVLVRNKISTGVLGVCINDKQILHMDLTIGSCLTKKIYLKDVFIKGFRLNEEN